MREVDQAAGQTCEDVLGTEPGFALVRVARGRWWPVWWNGQEAIGLTPNPVTKRCARRVIKSMDGRPIIKQQVKWWIQA
jgi:hypothetical protein